MLFFNFFIYIFFVFLLTKQNHNQLKDTKVYNHTNIFIEKEINNIIHVFIIELNWKLYIPLVYANYGFIQFCNRSIFYTQKYHKQKTEI